MRSRDFLIIVLAAIIALILLAYAYRGADLIHVPPTTQQQPADTKPSQ